MSAYRPIYFQKLTTNAPVVDSLVDYDMYIKSFPYKPMADIKDPFIKDWPDESGNDVYIPATPVYKAYDIDCEFIYVGSRDSATPAVKLFIKYISENGLLKFYDSYTGIGRTKVNYKSLSQDIYYNEDTNIASFKLVMTVNDPVTEISFSQFPYTLPIDLGNLTT